MRKLLSRTILPTLTFGLVLVVDGQGVVRVEVLRVARHGAEVPQLVLDGVLVFLPCFGVEALIVDKAGRFVDVGLGLGGIVEVEALGEVVAELVIAGPVPLLRVGRDDDDFAATLVAQLAFRVVAIHFGVESDALRGVVEVDVLDDLQGGFRGPLGLGERLHGLGVACVVVAESAAIGLHQVIFDVGVFLEGLAVGERQVEVLDVVEVYFRHVATTSAQSPVGVSQVFFRLVFPFVVVVLFLLLYALFPDIHEVDVLLSGVVVDGGIELLPFLVAAHCCQGIFQFDVGVVGVVERGDVGLAIVEVHGNLESGAFEELAQFEVGRHVELRTGLKGVAGDVAVQGSEACRIVCPVDVHAAKVGEGGLQPARGGYAALAAEFGEAQFVDPHHGTFRQAVVVVGEALPFRVAYTNHHGLHVADAGVADDLDGVVIVKLSTVPFLTFSE